MDNGPGCETDDPSVGDQNKTWLFYVDGGYNFDPQTGSTMAGGRYFWNPGKEWLGSLQDGEELAEIQSRADNTLHDQYVVYPYSLATVNRVKCVVATCLHILMQHHGQSFCFVTDVADKIQQNLEKVETGRRKLGSETLWRSLLNMCNKKKKVMWVQCESRDKLDLEMRRNTRLKKTKSKKKHQHGNDQ